MTWALLSTGLSKVEYLSTMSSRRSARLTGVAMVRSDPLSPWFSQSSFRYVIAAPCIAYCETTI